MLIEELGKAEAASTAPCGGSFAPCFKPCRALIAEAKAPALGFGAAAVGAFPAGRASFHIHATGFSLSY